MTIAAQGLTWGIPLLRLLAALLLLLAFAMLAQRRLLTLIHLLAWQGVVLAAGTALVALLTGQAELWFSATLTLALKAILIPMVLHRLLRRLQVRGDVEAVLNIPVTLLAGIALVIFAFSLAAPISALTGTVTRGMVGIALAAVLLAFLMMITRHKAISQVVGFLAIDNGLFFAATSATLGMPMVVELGVALDALIGFVILGIFFFQMRETFDSMDLRHLERIREE
ncbi:formate hydrogenlyase [Acidithiobacillus ferrianus]|uniref:Formate hydrogenlyase n=2 Tax=Acidithiobacillus ferrianus TaxID=2678518 RepID=A0A845UF14_9PROT|nr:formate hydrogenlyase [Acidithiobacillus ferrianus]NDU43170.1 formate hydrogenlyase [Acidithiobacillus ferrianus]